MSEIRGPCPHHEGSTRGSDSYSFNTYKNRGFCQSCGLKTWVGDGGDLMGKHGEHGKAFLIREGGPEITPRKPYKGQGDTMTAPKVGGHYADFRGIHKSVREFYGVLSYETDTTTEQHYKYPSGGLKIRTEPGKKFTAKNLHLDELFGMNLFPAGCSKMITITEGEEDCMAAYQMLKGGSYINPVVGLPGATPSPKLWEKCKGYLDSFEKIVLSVDTDEPGDKLAEKISQIFPGKVYRINHGTHKDANEILLAGEAASYKSSWWKAKLVKPDTILSDEEDYLKLYEESPDFEYFTTGIPELDSKILGICKGYLTLIQAESGLGKSLAPDTLVIKSDGSVVTAKEVSVGDHLLGPDGKPRKVTNVNMQEGPMYRITPVKGDPFDCNADHILSLQKVGGGEIRNVILTEYLKWGKAEKAKWKLWRSGEISFKRYSGTYYSSDLAYCVGAYLGDGRAQGQEICMGKKKQAVIDRMVESYLEPTRIKFDRGAYYIGFSKKSVLWASVEGCLHPRMCPDMIKYGPLDTRKNFLAGILDTDGSLTVGGAEVTQKSEALADDICFISRSLGLAAYKKVKFVNGAEYYRVGISGDMLKIPCQRLKFSERKQIKNVLHTGFTVTPIGVGKYRGIALDGDHLFLLGDFTVTHNTEFIRYLENRLLTTSNYKFAAKHMEETKLRSLLGLVSYDLGKNVTIKKFIEDGNLDEEVRASIKNITESGRFIIFDFDEDGSNEDLINQLRYLIHGMGVDYIFIEPIQDAVTGANSSEKEGKLSDLVTRLSNLAAQTGAGIVIVAHQNSDGGSMYSSMITKRAAFKIVLTGDRESEDPIERNRTYLHVKDKNRTGLGMGAAGILDFDLESYTLSPELPKGQPTMTRKIDNDIPF